MMMMMKTLAIVLCGVLAVTQAQESTFELVPFVANLCNQGCPQVCQTLRTFCLPRAGTDCDEIKAQCDSVCESTCSCVTACGPNCDDFESNCVANGLPALAGVFCPINGGICDVSCVVSCPQQVLSGLLQETLGQVSNSLQGFIQMIMAMGRRQSESLNY